MLVAMFAALLGAAADPSAPARPEAPATVAPEKKPRKRSGKPPMAGVLNVNRASEAELRLLPGIGKKRAQLIVERREKKAVARVGGGGRLQGVHALVQERHAHLTVPGGKTPPP